MGELLLLNHSSWFLLWIPNLPSSWYTFWMIMSTTSRNGSFDYLTSGMVGCLSSTSPGWDGLDTVYLSKTHIHWICSHSMNLWVLELKLSSTEHLLVKDMGQPAVGVMVSTWTITCCPMGVSHSHGYKTPYIIFGSLLVVVVLYTSDKTLLNMKNYWLAEPLGSTPGVQILQLVFDKAWHRNSLIQCHYTKCLGTTV